MSAPNMIAPDNITQTTKDVVKALTVRDEIKGLISRSRNATRSRNSSCDPPDSCATNRREELSAVSALTMRTQSLSGSSFDVSQACVAF